MHPIDRIRYNKTNQRGHNLKYLYGITVEEYNLFFSNQKGCCAICGKHQSNFKRRLAVDHCHISEKIRGLLCVKCNMGLGAFKDSKENLQKAIEYLVQE